MNKNILKELEKDGFIEYDFNKVTDKKEKISTIYIFTNLINGKQYIGQTKNLHQRVYLHFYYSKNKCRCYKFQNALAKYGVKNFKLYYKIISVLELNSNEIFYIKKFNTLSPNGYNLTEGGDKGPAKKGGENGNAKKIVCLDTSEIFGCIKEASDKYKINRNGIKNVCDGKNFSIKGYHFKYLDGCYDTNKELLNISKLENLKKEESFNKIICAETNEIFNTLNEIKNKYNYDPSMICACCNGKRKFAYSLHWAYLKNFNTEDYTNYLNDIQEAKENKCKNISNALKGKIARKNNPNSKKIICFETKDMFDCIKDAAEKYNLNYSSLRGCLQGRVKICGGYHWMYYKDYIKQQENNNQGVA